MRDPAERGRRPSRSLPGRRPAPTCLRRQDPGPADHWQHPATAAAARLEPLAVTACEHILHGGPQGRPSRVRAGLRVPPAPAGGTAAGVRHRVRRVRAASESRGRGLSAIYADGTRTRTRTRSRQAASAVRGGCRRAGGARPARGGRPPSGQRRRASSASSGASGSSPRHSGCAPRVRVPAGGRPGRRAPPPSRAGPDGLRAQPSRPHLRGGQGSPRRAMASVWSREASRGPGPEPPPAAKTGGPGRRYLCRNLYRFQGRFRNGMRFCVSFTPTPRNRCRRAGLHWEGA